MKKIHPNHKIHVNISDVVKKYKCVGMSTPFITANKCQMLLHEDFIENRIAFVVIDAIRCSSTILAAFSSGISSMTIMVKGGEKGTKPEIANKIATNRGKAFLLGGELNGQPIPEGIIGNSPTEATQCEILNNKHLHFQSTNFGGSFTEVTNQLIPFIEFGGHADVFVSSFVNAESTANEIKNGNYAKVYLVAGGFYNCISLEDNLVAGQILHLLDINYNNMDDEARMMLSLYNTYNTPEKQYEVLKTNWITSSLSCFGKEGDVKSIIYGDGISHDSWERMKNIVPKVIWHEKTPIIINPLNK